MPPRLDHARWFIEEVRPHEPALRAYLRGRFPMLPDLDDLVQETYARVFRARDKGGVEIARPYLFATARNAALDYFRRQRGVSTEILRGNALLGVVEDKPDAAELTSQKQEIDLLREAIAGLPERCRRALLLRRFEGLSYAEIARTMGISEKTVDAHLRQALFSLRASLLARGVSRDLLAQPRGAPDEAK